jgi:hypothetical protein
MPCSIHLFPHSSFLSTSTAAFIVWVRCRIAREMSLSLWLPEPSILRSGGTTQPEPGHFNNAFVHFICLDSPFLWQCRYCYWRHSSSSITPISCIKLSTFPKLFRILRYSDTEPTSTSSAQVPCKRFQKLLLQIQQTQYFPPSHFITH